MNDHKTRHSSWKVRLLRKTQPSSPTPTTLPIVCAFKELSSSGHRTSGGELINSFLSRLRWQLPHSHTPARTESSRHKHLGVASHTDVLSCIHSTNICRRSPWEPVPLESLTNERKSERKKKWTTQRRKEFVNLFVCTSVFCVVRGISFSTFEAADDWTDVCKLTDLPEHQAQVTRVRIKWAFKINK